MPEPRQKPGESKQDYGTPWDFIRAVELRFGPLAWDLAASPENAKAPNFITKEQDTFTVAWHTLDGNGWLNPEFRKREEPCGKNCKKKGCAKRGSCIDVTLPGCEDFMRKAYEESLLGARLFALTPASVGSDWFKRCVHKKAFWLALNGRLTFEGCTDPYPKDLILTCFGMKPVGLGYDVWDWRETLKQAEAAPSLFTVSDEPEERSPLRCPGIRMPYPESGFLLP